MYFIPSGTKITRVFHQRSGRTIRHVENYPGTIEDLKKKLVAKWGQKAYRFELYDKDDTGDSEWICVYAEIDPNEADRYSYSEIEFLYITEPPSICECGSESIGGTRHAFWCAKYEKF